MSETLFKDLINQLNLYKKKYYLNALLKGALLSGAVVISTYIILNTVEYLGRLPSSLRLTLLVSFVLIAGYAFWKWLLQPILQLLNINNTLSDEEAAKQIGLHFPEVQDKLLNTLQLRNLDSHNKDLVVASISQKTNSLSFFKFTEAVNLNENKKYTRYIFPPLIASLLIAILLPDLFLLGTKRIIHYDQHFATPAPFSFNLMSKELTAFKNEDYKVQVDLQGEAVPQEVYIIIDEKRSKLVKDSSGSFSFIIRNIQKSESFYFEAAGFNSSSYHINLIQRPSLLAFDVKLTYPKYLKRPEEVIRNSGNLSVPEGTLVEWSFNTQSATKMQLKIGSEESLVTSENNRFAFSKKIIKSTNYSILLSNSSASIKENISFYVEVIPDRFPAIQLKNYSDTSTYNFINLAGIITDDYGFTNLKIFYTIKDKTLSGSAVSKQIKLPLDQKNNSQDIRYYWPLDSLRLSPGQSLEYYVKVWDNDALNGFKSSQSEVYNLKVPSLGDISKELNESDLKTESNIESLLKEAQNLKKELNKAEQKLKKNNSLSWQDKKNLENLLNEHKSLEEQIQKIQQENKINNEKFQKFKKSDPELASKLDQLQKLMDQLLDDETKKLYDELQKLLNENKSKNELQEQLEQLKSKDENLNNELERTLELFKQMQFEKKLDETVQDLKKLSEDQNKLSETTKESKDKDLPQHIEEQNELKKQFDEVEKKLEELKEENQNLEDKNQISDVDTEKEDVQKEQQESLEKMKAGEQKKAAEAQKEAGKKMKEMADKISEMQDQNGMEQAQEDIGDLRAILENLITLSFEQESLMKEFRKVNQSDPRFITLSQKQLKLKDDSKIIEDSLIALSKRVFEIQSFVTREVSEMKGYMTESSNALKNRRPDIATGKQQFAMTSINNLALMLNDALKNMQEQMANAMANAKGDKKGKKKGSKAGIGELQKQLNEKINALKQSGKSGKELSEELAKLAAEQEMIRKALQEMQGKEKPGEGKGGGNLSKLKEEMEQTETDLVNKKLSQQTINRQQEILTRLLEAEKATKEREQDQKRESNSAKELPNSPNGELEKYLKEKQKEVEFLKTISPYFTPYYKQEVNEYFEKIEK